MRRRLNGRVSFAMAAADAVQDRVLRKAKSATRDYVEWVLEARRKLTRWNARPGGNPPVTSADWRQRQREAVKDGADVSAAQALELDEPESLAGLDAERRLIESVLGQRV